MMDDRKQQLRRVTDDIVTYMQASFPMARTRKEIAEHLGIETATVSGRVHNLVALGTLRQQPHKVPCPISRNVVGQVVWAR